MGSAVKDEVKRKLGYIRKITGEAEALLDETEINPGNYDMLETVKILADMNNALLEQLRTGKKSADPEMESRFKQIGKRYLELKRAELAISMDEIDLDVLDDIKSRTIPRNQ